MGFKGIKNHQIFFKMNQLETQIVTELHKYVRIFYFIFINSIEK